MALLNATIYCPASQGRQWLYVCLKRWQGLIIDISLVINVLIISSGYFKWSIDWLYLKWCVQVNDWISNCKQNITSLSLWVGKSVNAVLYDKIAGISLSCWTRFMLFRKQWRPRSAGFWRSHLIRIHTALKLNKVANIRNWYNQVVPHRPRIPHGKVTKIQLNTTNESQEVSLFPAGDHKNSKWVWSGNTTITNCRQPRGTARKSRSTITRHQEDK